MFGNKGLNRLRQPRLFSHDQTFADVLLNNFGTQPGIVNAIVFVRTAHLIFHEPQRIVHFADIVIERARPYQLHVASQVSGGGFGESRDEQSMLERAGGFSGEAFEQGAIGIGQLRQSNRRD